MGNTNSGAEEAEDLAKSRFRKWCFTHYFSNSEITLEGNRLEKVLEDKGWEYLFSHEICPKTKRDHFQGFIIYKDPIAFTTLTGIIHGHIEKAGQRCRKGTSNDAIILQNWNYIKKERRQCWTNIDLEPLKSDEDMILDDIRRWEEETSENLMDEADYLKKYAILGGIILPTDLKYTFNTLSKHKKDWEKINKGKGVPWKCPDLLIMMKSTNTACREYELLKLGIVQNRLNGESMLIHNPRIVEFNM